MPFPKYEEPSNIRFIGVFESEEAANTCISCMGYTDHIKRRVHTGNGNGIKPYALYIKEKV